MASHICVKLVMMVLGAIAFGLGIAAEQHRSQATIVPDATKRYDYCVYNSNIATGYGIGALLFLAVMQIVLMVASRCLCCYTAFIQNIQISKRLVSILFLLTWVTFLMAEACLLAGSVRNAYHTRYRGIFNGKSLSCEMVRKGIFATGAAFTILTAILGEIYYSCFVVATVHATIV